MTQLTTSVAIPNSGVQNLVELLKSRQATTFNGESDIQTKSIVQGREYQVDLECILKIEQKLWNILDVFAQSESKENVFEF